MYVHFVTPAAIFLIIAAQYFPNSADYMQVKLINEHNH